MNLLRKCATVGLEAMFAGPLCGALDESSPQRRPALAAGEWTAFAAYIVGPVLGAAAGALFYEFIRCQAPTDREVKGCC